MTGQRLTTLPRIGTPLARPYQFWPSQPLQAVSAFASHHGDVALQDSRHRQPTLLRVGGQFVELVVAQRVERPARGSTEEPGFEAQATHERAEKEAIAAAAAGLVQPGTAVGLSAGTTTWTLARNLREIPEITVVTNSIRIAQVLRTR